MIDVLASHGTTSTPHVLEATITEDLIRWNEYLAGNLDTSGIPSSLFLDVVNDPLVTVDLRMSSHFGRNLRTPSHRRRCAYRDLGPVVLSVRRVT